MGKEIEIVLLREAKEFFDNLPEKAKEKAAFSFYKTKNGYKGEWFKKLPGTDGLFEFRIRDQGNFYRLFAFWDKSSLEETLVVSTHGFKKKSNKTPKRELDHALSVRSKYFEQN
ncbi:type II toxin-antitoxin system RelE/ParE family toxin [Chitinophagales bacterium]|nr:type II toxin-antitoxin system RelE/ParE family toxin [Chitinophagales bacterium]